MIVEAWAGDARMIFAVHQIKGVRFSVQLIPPWRPLPIIYLSERGCGLMLQLKHLLFQCVYPLREFLFLPPAVEVAGTRFLLVQIGDLIADRPDAIED